MGMIAVHWCAIIRPTLATLVRMFASLCRTTTISSGWLIDGHDEGRRKDAMLAVMSDRVPVSHSPATALRLLLRLAAHLNCPPPSYFLGHDPL